MIKGTNNQISNERENIAIDTLYIKILIRTQRE